MSMSEIELIECYSELKERYEKYLKKFGVSLPRLKIKDNYTKDALVLIYLYSNFQKPVSKEDLTNFLGEYGERPNDVQQARHLGQQKGWYIISGQRRDKECEEYNVKPGEYALISVEKHYPNFTNLKRTDNLSGDEGSFLKNNIIIGVLLVDLLKVNQIYIIRILQHNYKKVIKTPINH